MKRLTKIAFLAATFSLLACSYHEAKHQTTSDVGQPTPTYKYLAASVFSSCTDCHGATVQKKGVRLDTYADVMKKVVAKSAAQSPIMEKMTDDDDPMPPDSAGGKLSDDKIKLVEDWINNGALNN